jgi:hypothetical protein
MANAGHRQKTLRHRAACRISKVALQVLTKPDTEGRLLPMIRTVAGYARKSGQLDVKRLDAALEAVERGLVDGNYLAITPQFLVTATE